MLANDKFASDALLSVPRLRIPTHISHKRHHHRLPWRNYVNDMVLIVTRPKLTMAAAVHKELDRSASAWAAGLNATGGALKLNPDKCKWTLADYCWHNGRWG
jgi:hypothetical protein